MPWGIISLAEFGSELLSESVSSSSVDRLWYPVKMHVGCFIFGGGGGGGESRPVDGDGGVCKKVKVLLLPQNGVILVRPIIV